MKVIFWHSAIAQADFDFLITVQNSCSGFCTFGNQHQLALRRMLLLLLLLEEATFGGCTCMYRYMYRRCLLLLPLAIDHLTSTSDGILC